MRIEDHGGREDRGALAQRRAAFRARLATGPPIVLDGATGTELERRGVRSELPLWSAHALLEAPGVVEEIHADYARAGAELLTANTFRTQRRTLARGGLDARARELTALAVRLARSAAVKSASSGCVSRFVAGSDAPLEDCFRPDLVPEEPALRLEHAEHVTTLDAVGADVILIETMNSVREALAALRSARETGAPTLVSFTCTSAARLRSGETLEAAVAAVRELAPDALLVNCVEPALLDDCLPVLRDSGLAFGASPNLGAPLAGGGRSGELDPSAFAELGALWAHAGARIVGGCCGTTPDHIRALVARLAT